MREDTREDSPHVCANGRRTRVSGVRTLLSCEVDVGRGVGKIIA